MYGRSKALVQEPPLIIVSANDMFDPTLFSQDRWVIHLITENKDLRTF